MKKDETEWEMVYIVASCLVISLIFLYLTFNK